MEHDLVIAETGQEGVRQFSDPPTLVFIDIHLPDMNGLDLVWQLRNAHHTMPIIALTGDVWN